MQVNYAERKPLDCTRCPLYNAPGPVYGIGPDNAKFIYIAQNPGKEEIADVTAMEPLIGPSGRVFNRQLTQASIRRSSIFITNIVKCKTPDNREPTEEEIKCCAPLLQVELQRCTADVIVLAGSIAFNALIGSYSTLSPNYHPSTSIYERMGCVEQLDGHKWIGTVHPANIMRLSGTPVQDEAVDHLRKAAELSGVTVPLPRVIEEPTEEDIQRHREAARTRKIFADDIEAEQVTSEEVTDEDEYGHQDWKMDICGFSAIDYEAIVFSRDKLHLAHWDDIWINPSITQVEHNGESDRFYLEQVSPQFNERFDTMLAHHFLNNNIHKYLKPECLRLYTNLPYYNRDLEQQVGRKFYNGMDCITTLLVAQRQIELMKEDVYVDVRGLEMTKLSTFRSRLWNLYNGTAFSGEPALKDILPILEEQRNIGLRIDLRKALLFYYYLAERIERAERGVRDILGPLFNWRSYGPTGDVQRLFYQTWRLPPQYNKDKKTHKQKLTCDKKAREHLKEWVNDDNYPDRKSTYAQAARYFDLADEASEASKLLEYISRIESDGRVHAMQKAHGTDTYRISSKPNTQNWPSWSIGGQLPSMRSMVLPDSPEDILLTYDFDQVELWTYAAQFDIKYLLEVYKSGNYLYGEVAEEFFKRPFFKTIGPRTKDNKREDITEQDLRDFKELPLGLQYGSRPEAVAKRRGWTLEFATKMCNEWRKRNPELYQTHDWITYEMTQKRVLRPPPGMLLHYPAPALQGINCFGQTPAAILLWTSMILIDKQLKALGAGDRIILSMHDSITLNVKGGLNEPARVARIHHNICMPVLTRPIHWLKDFRYRASSKVSQMWDWEMTDTDKWIQQRSSHANIQVFANRNDD